MLFFAQRSENETEWLVPELFVLFKKASNEVKAGGQQLSSQCILVVLNSGIQEKQTV